MGEGFFDASCRLCNFEIVYTENTMGNGHNAPLPMVTVVYSVKHVIPFHVSQNI